MKHLGQTTPLPCLLALVVVSACFCRASAQIGIFNADNRYELSETVQLDMADSAVVAQLQRVDACLADSQWDEAVETLRGLLENSDDKLLGVTDKRFVSLRDWVHLKLANLPPEALKLYRGRVDSLAKQWYESGIVNGDRDSLRRVVRQAFASSWGDDAMMALGEIALESGDHAAARWYWHRIIPAKLPPGGKPTWPGYPDTQLDLAAVRARLVLVSILEGSTARATDELAQLVRLHPEATGRIGGREANYGKALGTMLAESAKWPTPPAKGEWPTFAGSPPRNTIAIPLTDVAGVAWQVPLRKVTASAPWTATGSVRAVEESSAALPSYHPLLHGNLLLYNNRLAVYAVDARTGKPAWGTESGAIYRDQLDGSLHSIHNPPGTLGVPRFTMTVFDGKLLSRMGNTLTGKPRQSSTLDRSSYLVCLDLEAEGRLNWKIDAEDGWAFEGSPVSDGANIYVGMRRSDIRPQAFVACFDLQTGKPRWRRFICGADTPASGMLSVGTHNLLTLVGGSLYYNTNLGAVAAISTNDGSLRWVSLYPRQRQGDLTKMEKHWNRDLNPCVYDRGTLYVAPADSPRIFAFDAATGQMLWQSGSELDDVDQLLGAADGHLIAGGDRLYWIGTEGEHAGRIRHMWPRGSEKLGFGRGLLSGNSVLWPTRDEIFVFDRKTAKQTKVIELRQRSAEGGNLLVADGRLLIAGGSEIVGFSITPTKPPRKEDIAGMK